MKLRFSLPTMLLASSCLLVAGQSNAKSSEVHEAYLNDGELILIGSDLCLEHPVISFGTAEIYPLLSQCGAVEDGVEMMVVSTGGTEFAAGSYRISVREDDKKAKGDDPQLIVTIGEIGAVGDDGLQGKQGPRGSQGVQGLTGAMGAQGEVGPAGPAGAAGLEGPVGLPGVVGVAGSAGIQGPRGSPGAVGLPGPKGVTGEIGPQGPAGSAGQQGPQGQRGLDGEQGSAGTVIGPVGLVGIQGPRGDVGPQGLDGPRGLRGVEGPDGEMGRVGAIGIDGDARWDRDSLGRSCGGGRGAHQISSCTQRKYCPWVGQKVISGGFYTDYSAGILVESYPGADGNNWYVNFHSYDEGSYNVSFIIICMNVE